MLTVALAPWVRPVAYCEADRYAQAVLLSRMSENSIPIAPIWDDVATLDPCELPRRVDIICGGFPCTDISTAGHGVGLEGSRSGLFFHIVRLARALRPRFIFLENVPAITLRGLDRVLLELTALWYDSRWTIVSAGEMGAPHSRERWFLLAHAHGFHGGDEWQDVGRRKSSLGQRQAISQQDGLALSTSDAVSEGRQRWFDAKTAWQTFALGGGGGSWPSWLPQPAIRRGDDGSENRMDALKALGNGVPPQCYREAFMLLMGMKQTCDVKTGAKESE